MSENRSVDCDVILEFLSLGSERCLGDRSELVSHLEECAECQSAWQRWSSVVSGLRCWEEQVDQSLAAGLRFKPWLDGDVGGEVAESNQSIADGSEVRLRENAGRPRTARAMSAWLAAAAAIGVVLMVWQPSLYSGGEVAKNGLEPQWSPIREGVPSADGMVFLTSLMHDAACRDESGDRELSGVGLCDESSGENEYRHGVNSTACCQDCHHVEKSLLEGESPRAWQRSCTVCHVVQPPQSTHAGVCKTMECATCHQVASN